MDVAARPILVIASEVLAERVRTALSDRTVTAVATPIAGVWELGRQPDRDVLLSLAGGQEVSRVLPTLRQVAPRARIVVSCPPAAEPIARDTLLRDADEYLLEPIDEHELQQAFRRPLAPPALERGEKPAPSLAELAEFAEILRNLNDGPQATLDRFTALVQRSLSATGVAVSVDSLEAVIGDPSDAVLEEVIRRQGETVGRITLGRRIEGTYSAPAASRVSDLARLVDAAIQEARERDRLRLLAWTDDLSGLRNRRYFEEQLDELIAHAADQRSRVTVLLFDIDDFKQYNDRFGHDTGDALIQELGVLLKRCSRVDDIVSRYGGDEFAVIFWDAEQPRVAGSKHPDSPEDLSARFQETIRDHRFACLGADAPGPVTISGGLACYPWHGRDRASLMKAADQALLEAKRTGKNHIHLAGAPFAAQVGDNLAAGS